MPVDNKREVGSIGWAHVPFEGRNSSEKRSDAPEDRYCPRCMRPLRECHCLEGRAEERFPHHLRLWERLRSDGRYILGDVLGQGGFGITYIARDTMLDTRVAIKEFFPSGQVVRNVDGPGGNLVVCKGDLEQFELGRSRFFEEARVLLSLEDVPGMVKIRDVFAENCTNYFAMDLLVGEDLDSYISRNRMDARTCFERMLPIAEALVFIGERGLVHRDVSPSNIKVLEDGSFRLMDFGAVRQSNFLDGRPVTTAFKQGYSAPEQCDEKGKLGPWTDVYGFCATLYACIAGCSPNDSLQRNYSDTLEWPSKLGIEIDAGLESILRKGMSLDPDERYRSFVELKAAIETALNGGASRSSQTASVVGGMGTGSGEHFL